MTLPSTGAISLADVAIELGGSGTAAFNLDSYNARLLAERPIYGSKIDLQSLRGRSYFSVFLQSDPSPFGSGNVLYQPDRGLGSVSPRNTLNGYPLYSIFAGNKSFGLGITSPVPVDFTYVQFNGLRLYKANGSSSTNVIQFTSWYANPGVNDIPWVNLAQGTYNLIVVK